MDARALTENLATVLRHEHDALAEFLVALAEFDHRRLWIELGHASLFYFLHRELRLSKGAAQCRKVAAELIQQVPGIVEPLRDGRLCLSSVIEAAKVLTAENWRRDAQPGARPHQTESAGWDLDRRQRSVACRPHNILAARLILRDELMDRYGPGLRGPRRPRSADADDGAPSPSPP